MCQKEYRMHTARILAKSGLKQAQIAAQLGVSDRMVRKYLKEDYLPKERKARQSLLDPFKCTISSVLEEDHFYNIEVLADRLRAMGYQGGMTILRDYAAAIRTDLITRAVMRFETEPGRQAQVDWKECGRWTIDGQERKVYAFVMLLGYSRRAYVRFTTSMKSPVLLACHSKAFAWFDGVPAEILYDNMKTAWLADGSGWRVQPALLSYASQVGFAPRRCQVRRPQTKGKVERFIGYLGNHFLPVARDAGLSSLDDLNAAVMDWLAKVDQETLRDFFETRAERFECEKNHLRPWVPEAAPDIRARYDLQVSREGLVTFESNRYSVPAALIGKTVLLRHDPLGRTATLYDGPRELYGLTLLPAGGHGRLVRTQDADDLRARWDRENRRLTRSPASAPPVTDTPPARSDIDVQTRHPSSYEQLLEGA